MPRVQVHRFDVRSRDERDLRNRLATFGRAVHAQDGSILDISWEPPSPSGDIVATVVYELPCTAMPDDAA